MRFVLRSVVAPAVVLLAFAAAAFAFAPIDGKWTGTVNGPEGPIDMVLDLMANGEVLTGTATFPMFPAVPLTNGMVTDTAVSFDLVFGEMSFTLPYRGKLDGESLKLVAEGPFGGDTITFVRVPAN